MFADYFISYDIILIIIKDFGFCPSNVICEIGKYNKNEKCINIKYLLDIEKIIDSENLNDKLKNEVSYIYKEISRNKIDNDEIEFKEYSFDFDNNNQNKIKHIGNNNKKEKSIIIDENEDEDIKIFKKNNLNYIEVKLNNARRDSDN